MAPAPTQRLPSSASFRSPAGIGAAIPSSGGRAIGVLADVTSFAAIAAMRARVEVELGSIEVLVADAGGSLIRPGPVERITENGWRASFPE